MVICCCKARGWNTVILIIPCWRTIFLQQKWIWNPCTTTGRRNRISTRRVLVPGRVTRSIIDPSRSVILFDRSFERGKDKEGRRSALNLNAHDPQVIHLIIPDSNSEVTRAISKCAWGFDLHDEKCFCSRVIAPWRYFRASLWCRRSRCQPFLLCNCRNDTPRTRDRFPFCLILAERNLAQK